MSAAHCCCASKVGTYRLLVLLIASVQAKLELCYECCSLLLCKQGRNFVLSAGHCYCASKVGTMSLVLLIVSVQAK